MTIINYDNTSASNESLRDEILHSDVFLCSKEYLSSKGYAVDWAVSATVNALYKLNYESFTAEYVTSFPDEKNIGRLYSLAICKFGSKLMFSPLLARNWLFYNTKNGEWDKVEIPEEATPKAEKDAAFWMGVISRESIIFLPGKTGVFAKYNINDNSFKYYHNLSEKFKEYNVNPSLSASWNFDERDGKLYITSPRWNIVTILDMDSMKFQFEEIGHSQNRYLGIAFCNDRFWLTKYRDPLSIHWKEGFVSWNPDTGECNEYNDIPAKQAVGGHEGFGFNAIVATDGFVFVFPYCADAIIKINHETKEMERLELKPPFDYHVRKSNYYSIGGKSPFVFVVPHKDDKAFVVTSYDYRTMIIDLKTGNCEERIKWRVNGIEYLLASRNHRAYEPWHENIFITQADFIKYIANGQIPAFDKEQANYHQFVDENLNGSCGKKIHEHIMGHASHLTSLGARASPPAYN